jgi:RNA polymerase-binding protein DksA
MGSIDLADARHRLEAEHSRVEAQLLALERDHAQIVAASMDSNADDEHDPEGATIAFEREQVLALIEAARRTIGEVDAALARVDDGAYGVCATCGEAIAAARLEARPTARTCISCAR